MAKMQQSGLGNAAAAIQECFDALDRLDLAFERSAAALAAIKQDQDALDKAILFNRGATGQTLLSKGSHNGE